MKGTRRIAAVVVMFLLAVSTYAMAWPVPDTGQTQSYTETFGEDSDYTINTPSYTKLDAQGNELPDSAASWVMVRDNVTGLIWEMKTDDGTIHDKDNRYTWLNAQTVFIAQLNTDKFGGHDDWRMPTVKELSSTVNSGRWAPSINTDYFPNTMSSSYWSSTTGAGNTGGAWLVSFYYGYVSHDGKSYACYVRAVRAGQTGSFDNLVINGDGTVKDTSTGLIWQQETAGPMTWEGALSYCEGLVLGGHSDWRLPNRNELQSIVDYNKYVPAIDTIAFPNTMSSSYWSSTTDAYGTDLAWYVYFHYGYVYYYIKSDAYYVRAVRAGGSFDDLVILQISVQDEDTKYPIDGAHVTVGSITEETDDTGMAVFPDLALGEYEITIEASGYAPYHTTMQLSTPGTVSVQYSLRQLCPGDFDKDGDVDVFDLGIFAADFGRTDCPSSETKASVMDALIEENARLKAELAAHKDLILKLQSR